MFVQIIRSKAKDPGGIRKMWEKAEQELAPGAIGFLGSTGGLADDGTSIAAVRFESEEAARENSARPEQDAWAREFQQFVEGAIQYVDSTDIETFGRGGSDDAGFVQVIQARATDRRRLDRLNKEFQSTMREARPDLIGGIVAWHPKGTGWFTNLNYFTSESEAREGERREMPSQLKTMGDEWMSLMQDVEYLDLHDPWMSSP